MGLPLPVDFRARLGYLGNMAGYAAERGFIDSTEQAGSASQYNLDYSPSDGKICMAQE